MIALRLDPLACRELEKGQPEGVNCIRFTQLTHSHRVTTPLTSVKVQKCLPLPKRLPRGGLFTPDDSITVLIPVLSKQASQVPAEAG